MEESGCNVCYSVVTKPFCYVFITTREGMAEEEDVREKADSENEGGKKKKEKKKKKDKKKNDGEASPKRSEAADGDDGDSSNKRGMKPSAIDHVAEKLEWERRRAEKSKNGGVYIPPFKLKEMQQSMEDKSSEKYQRYRFSRLTAALAICTSVTLDCSGMPCERASTVLSTRSMQMQRVARRVMARSSVAGEHGKHQKYRPRNIPRKPCSWTWNCLPLDYEGPNGIPNIHACVRWSYCHHQYKDA